MTVMLFSILCSAQVEDSMSVKPDSSDFITASLLIVQPDQNSMITYYGHAAMRLQCPSSHLDYCFSFDSFTSGNFWALITGADRTTLLPVATPDFIKQYSEKNRKVYEHELNLTLDEERRLWQLVDRLVEQGPYLMTDFLNHGCAGETASIITSVINGHIIYPPTLQQMDNSQYEIIDRYMDNSEWTKLMLSLFSGHDALRTLNNNEEKLMLPSVLEMIWKETNIEDAEGKVRPIFAPKDIIVYDVAVESQRPKVKGQESGGLGRWVMGPEFWAMCLLVLVIVLSIAELFDKKVQALGMALDVLLMTIQTFIGLVLVALLVCSTLPTTAGWNWNIIVFNPLPLLVWLVWKWKAPQAKQRMWVYAVYTLVTLLFFINMICHTNFFVPTQYYLVAAMCVRCAFLCASSYKENIINHKQ